jgi:hypothetical protein
MFGVNETTEFLDQMSTYKHIKTDPASGSNFIFIAWEERILNPSHIHMPHFNMQ